ncbi:fasciclin-like arabinogalactan protein 3 [Salvia hispanica]|uniref:fasciclin-like arabinogalactan protein 3 n=1 Tax=Salvia hispanica TaxID=49212 RepID=UPI0020096638|nr:fasciclin-like arabinogalactan protein 3 [Salvia hispanica]
MRRPFLLIAALILLSTTTTTSAFNITITLARFPGFEQFNQLLTNTHLAEQVNSRRTITVLGLPNDRIGTLMQLPVEVQRSILSLHVILDYFDMAKLAKLTPGYKTTLTTLYQSSGVANGQQGFIDIVRRRDGTIVFGSSVPGSPLVCNFVNPVAAQPFNISILSVSQPIIAPGMDGTYVETPPATPPPPPAVAAAAPAPAARKKAPPPVEETEAPAPAAAPAPASKKSPAPSPDADAAADEEEDADADAAADLTSEKETSGGVDLGVKLGVVIGLAALVAVAGQ